MFNISGKLAGVKGSISFSSVLRRCVNKVPIALVNALMVDTNLNSVQHLFSKLA